MSDKALTSFRLAFVVVTFCISSWVVNSPKILCAQNVFKVTTLSGETVSAQWDLLDESGQLSGEGLSGLNLEKVTAIESTREAYKSTAPVKAEIRLVDGGLIYADKISVVDEQVSFESGSGLSELPLDSIRGIVWNPTLLSESAERVVAQAFGNRSADKDTVIVDNGKKVSALPGLLEGLYDDKLHFFFNNNSETIGISKVVAVASADLKLQKPTGIKGSISLVDGSTVHGVLKSADASSILVSLSGGREIAVSRESFVGLTIDSDRVLFLSNMIPSEAEMKPVFSAAREWQKDKSVGGNPITLKVADPTADPNPKIFAKGLGVQSYSRLVFQNDNGFDRFQAIAGIDQETKGRGDCQMVVRGDGIELWSQRIRGNQSAMTVDVDITGIDQIELVVQPGEQFDLADHANWADAKFLKTK